MEVFISWSGARSLKVATALNEWLPLVIQSVVPWFSPEDINKGARWLTELSNQLDKQKMGIICVTPENMEAPWLLFEAGALSKVVDTSLVCPFLFELAPADLQGPLAQFQATRATKKDIRKLLSTINNNSEVPLVEQKIERLFDALWGDFQEKLAGIEASACAQLSRARPVPELLSEVLERVRSIERELTESSSREKLGAARASRESYERVMARRQMEHECALVSLHAAKARLATVVEERQKLEQMTLDPSESRDTEIENRLVQLADMEAAACAAFRQAEMASQEAAVALRQAEIESNAAAIRLRVQHKMRVGLESLKTGGEPERDPDG